MYCRLLTWHGGQVLGINYFFHTILRADILTFRFFNRSFFVKCRHSHLKADGFVNGSENKLTLTAVTKIYVPVYSGIRLIFCVPFPTACFGIKVVTLEYEVRLSWVEFPNEPFGLIFHIAKLVIKVIKSNSARNISSQQSHN